MCWLRHGPCSMIRSRGMAKYFDCHEVVKTGLGHSGHRPRADPVTANPPGGRDSGGYLYRRVVQGLTHLSETAREKFCKIFWLFRVWSGWILGSYPTDG